MVAFGTRSPRMKFKDELCKEMIVKCRCTSSQCTHHGRKKTCIGLKHRICHPRSVLKKRLTACDWPLEIMRRFCSPRGFPAPRDAWRPRTSSRTRDCTSFHGARTRECMVTPHFALCDDSHLAAADVRFVSAQRGIVRAN